MSPWDFMSGLTAMAVSKIRTITLQVETHGNTDVVDLTGRIRELLAAEGMHEGSVLVFAVGSTAAITTVEYEPGLVETDLKATFEKIAPYAARYAHNKTWGDDNGAAHLRASLVGPSLVVPFSEGRLLLGTWQQIVLIDFDTRPRRREVVLQLRGG